VLRKYNTFVVVLLERQREISTLMVLGMKEKEVLSIISLEQNITSIIGVILGLPIGKLFIIIMAKTIITDTFTMPTDMSLNSVLIALVLLVISVVSAQLLASRKLNKIEIDVDAAVKWLKNGAQPSDTARRILSYKGVLLKYHLLGGVAKGALTEEQAEAKFNAWVEEKANKVSTKEQKLAKEKAEAKAKALDAEKEANEKRKNAAVAKATEATAEATEEVTEATEATEAEAPAEENNETEA